MAGRKRWRPKNGKQKTITTQHVPGGWKVEYECGMIVNFAPVHSNRIEDVVRKAGHTCSRDKCKPIWYRRRE